MMFYECDASNCNVGPEHCRNRNFADLQTRTKKGGKFNVGVDVMMTKDRGWGIRANRTFRPGQIIMEYTGEIITHDEAENRMNFEYKNNKVCPSCSFPSLYQSLPPS
jgi:[histone H3]-lysine4 N-trimethyltransferase ASH1L